MTTTATRPEFAYDTTEKGPGYNKPQTMGRQLWAPMFLMGLTGFVIGVILSWIRAAEIASSNPDTDTVASLGHLVPAFMFIGFIGVFSAISFAIARILGAFRKGGGEIQETTGSKVQTLKMPNTARVFILSMAMGMMTIALMVVLHFVAAGSASSWSAESVERWSVVLEGFRRLGVALYLLGITFGLGTIITVLRFQAARIRQLPDPA
jgi:hypothetical protein